MRLVVATFTAVATLAGCSDSRSGVPCGTDFCESDEVCRFDVCVRPVGSANVDTLGADLGAKADVTPLAGGAAVLNVTIVKDAACFALGDPAQAMISLGFGDDLPTGVTLTSSSSGIFASRRASGAASSETATEVSLTLDRIGQDEVAGHFSAVFPSGTATGDFVAAVCQD